VTHMDKNNGPCAPTGTGVSHEHTSFCNHGDCIPERSAKPGRSFFLCRSRLNFVYGCGRFRWHFGTHRCQAWDGLVSWGGSR
jgi:hypothetical protein